MSTTTLIITVTLILAGAWVLIFLIALLALLAFVWGDELRIRRDTRRMWRRIRRELQR